MRQSEREVYWEGDNVFSVNLWVKVDATVMKLFVLYTQILDLDKDNEYCKYQENKPLGICLKPELLIYVLNLAEFLSSLG